MKRLIAVLLVLVGTVSMSFAGTLYNQYKCGCKSAVGSTGARSADKTVKISSDCPSCAARKQKESMCNDMYGKASKELYDELCTD